MEHKIVKAASLNEYLTPEHCYIAENYSSKELSIAVARVKPGVTTRAHHLNNIQEIYIITAGEGKIIFNGLEPTTVRIGDVIIIPAGVSQRIKNIGQTDLIFYCVCTPRFTENCYFDDEAEKPL